LWEKFWSLSCPPCSPFKVDRMRCSSLGSNRAVSEEIDWSPKSSSFCHRLLCLPSPALRFPSSLRPSVPWQIGYFKTIVGLFSYFLLSFPPQLWPIIAQFFQIHEFPLFHKCYRHQKNSRSMCYSMPLSSLWLSPSIRPRLPWTHTPGVIFFSILIPSWFFGTGDTPCFYRITFLCFLFPQCGGLMVSRLPSYPPLPPTLCRP